MKTVSIDLSPILVELIRIEALLWALAEGENQTDDKWTKFNDAFQKHASDVHKRLKESYPSLFSEK